MERLVLKQDIVDKIKKDPPLYGQIASLTGHTILSMRKVLNDNNSPKLTQIGVLKHLSEYLNIEQDDLLEEVTDLGHATSVPYSGIHVLPIINK